MKAFCMLIFMLNVSPDRLSLFGAFDYAFYLMKRECHQFIEEDNPIRLVFSVPSHT